MGRLILLLLVNVFSRLMPHLPNMSVMLLLNTIISSHYSRMQSMLFIFLSAFISDAGLALIYHYPLIGTWSLFSYSGLILLGLWGGLLQKNSALRIFGYSFLFTLIYWTWTNLGVFLTTQMYSKTWIGFYHCYYYALPFLGNQLLGLALAILGYFIITGVTGLSKKGLTQRLDSF